MNLLKKNTKNADVVRTSLRKSAAVSGLNVPISTPILLPLVSPCVMTCRDDVGTTGPDKSKSKRYLLVPNCFLGSRRLFTLCSHLDHVSILAAEFTVTISDNNTLAALGCVKF